jgi:hypothetical protein
MFSPWRGEMVARSYTGLGLALAAVAEFDKLLPHVQLIRALQEKCAPFSADDAALQLAVEGLQTAAFHFTRRPQYYEATRPVRQHGRNYYGGLGDEREAFAAFEQLIPYARELRFLQARCRPFGRDWLALEIPKKCLETAAYHFTKRGGFYGAGSDSAGRIRPHEPWEQ